MTIWTSKGAAALLGSLVLAGCDAAPTGQGLLAGLLSPGSDTVDRPPLTQALMMQGAITLVPPTGFCIDPNSLNQSFALLARCDTLGAATGDRGAPLGIMTVSLTPRGTETPLPTAADVATASDTSDPDHIRDRQDHIIFATEGQPPLPQMDERHWRAIAKVGGYTMGVALFGPKEKRAVSVEGAGLLEELIQRTQAKSMNG